MNNKTKNILLSVFIIVATIGVYLLLNHEIFDEALCWYALAVIVLSEAVLAFSWVTFSGKPQKLAVVTISGIQTVGTMLVSALFLNFAIEGYIGYSVYVILSFTALVFFSFFLFKSAGSTAKTENAKEFFLKCRLLVNGISTTPNGEVYRDELVKLEENIRFCNDGVLLESDKDIYSSICYLKGQVDNGGENILDIIANINALVQQHDFVVKTTPRN